MTNMPAVTVINKERCIGCGLCVRACPHGNLLLLNGKANATGKLCFRCDHCRSLCPSDAIDVQGLDLLSSVFRTFSAIETWAPYGQHKLFDLVNLIQSRRSCRNYLDKPIIADILDDLIKIGTSAPSGANSQMWTFSLLPDRRSVLALSEKVIVFFENLRRLSESPWLRILLKYVGYTKPAWYHKYFHQTMERRLDLWKHEDKDLIFYGAPAAIIVGSKTEAACPAEDAYLATQNILLAAHSMGLGTCLVGYAIEAINREKKIRQFLHIPDDEKPYSVIAVGYPCEEYQRLVRRKPVIKRIVKFDNSPS